MATKGLYAEIDFDLYRRLKSHAGNTLQSVRAIVEQAVREHLDRMEEKES